MLPDLVRRLSVMLLTLSLALGPAVTNVHASSMSAKMAVTALSDAPSSGMCDDCAGNKSGVPMASCSINCTGVTAVSSEVVVFEYLPVETYGYVATRGIAGQNVPPDPYPPRPTVQN